MHYVTRFYLLYTFLCTLFFSSYKNVSISLALHCELFEIMFKDNLINYSLDSGSFPSLWRKAFIITLPKNINPSLPKHFRPITILSFLYKVIEACVYKQLSELVYRQKLFSSLQSSFRTGQSIVSPFLKVTGDIRKGMEDT